MLFVEQIRYISSPTMVSSWSGTTIGKILFFLTVAVCVLSEAQGPAAAAENEPEKLTFSGRVVDTDGAPVANAEVRYAVSLYPLEGGAKSGYSTYPAPEYVARTEEDGTFRFELLPSRFKWIHLSSEKIWNRLHIAVTHPDYAIWWQELPFQSTADIEIQLETPGIISGKVMNEAGEPIQNAEVQIQHFFDGKLMQEETVGDLMPDALSQAVKTDANGEFVLRSLPQGATADLNVQGPGYAKRERHRVPVGTEELEFRLKRESRIEGRLTYAGTGKPVKDAGVALEGIYPTDGWGQARVDSNGNYLLKNIAPGMYGLHLAHGPKGWTALAKEFITVVGGQTVSNIDLTLIQSGFVTGRVTDQETDEPIANHSIRLNDAARPEYSQLMDHRTTTDETGTYRFDAAPGQALVHTNPPVGYQGFGRTGALNIGQIQRRVDVVEGETVVVDFQFSRGVELVGRLFTKTGEPVAGASIANVQDWHTEYGRSDESGGFTIGGLRPGQRLGLKAEHSELGLRGTIEIVVRPWLPIDIRMKPYERVKVSGRVIDHEGKPMRLVDVVLMHWDPKGHSGYGTIVAMTDDDGWFRKIELIVGDEYTISVEAEGYRTAETGQFTATAEMTQIEDLILLPAGGQFFIEGRVTDTSGEPVRAARLGISQGRQHWLRYTDENGNYRFEDLSMTVIPTLYIHHPGYTEHEFNILKTNQRHDLVLVKADGYLAGKVVDTDGKPIAESPPQSSPSLTPEQLAERLYSQACKERSKTLVNQPAPELAVAEWLSGSPISIEDLKGKTVALHFWHSVDFDPHQVRLLDALQEIYREKGLVCVTICPAASAVETIKRHIAEQALSHSIALDRPTTVIGAEGETFNRYAIGWAPIVLINTAGEITGHTWDDELEDQIQVLLSD